VFYWILIFKSRNLKFRQALLQSLVQSAPKNLVYLKHCQHFTVDSISFEMFRWYILTKINVNQVKILHHFFMSPRDDITNTTNIKWRQSPEKSWTFLVMPLCTERMLFRFPLFWGKLFGLCWLPLLVGQTCLASTVSPVAWTGQQNTAFSSSFSSFFSKTFMVTIPSSVFNTCPRKKESQLLYATATKWPLDTYVGKQDINS